MQIQGLVVGVKDGSYNSKTGKHVAVWSIDVYDNTAGVVACQMAGGADVVPPAVRTEIVADVIALRKLNFGTGVQVTITNVRPVNGSSSSSLPPPPPPPLSPPLSRPK